MPSSETQFKRGKSGNPKGRPKMTSEERAYRELLNEEVLRAFYHYGHLTGAQLEKLSMNENLSARERLSIKLFARSLVEDKYCLRYIRIIFGISSESIFPRLF